MNARYLYGLVLWAAFCLFLLCLSGSLAAQATSPPPGSFTDLRGRIAPGMEVIAIDNSGKKIRGQVAEITSTTLVLEDNGNRITFLDATLAEVRERKNDSVLNGALIGALTAGVPLMLAATTCHGDCDSGAVALFAGLCGGAGAGVGALIDSAIKTEVVIYNRVQMKPAIGAVGRRHSPGLGLSVRW